MPTQQQYRDQLLLRLNESFRPQMLAATPEQVFSLEELAEILGGILAELEVQHLGASTHIQALMAGDQPSEPWDGHGELAFMLYYLHHTPPELRSEIDSLPELKIIWDTMAAVAAPSPFTPDSFTALANSLPRGTTVKCTKWGDIYGTGTYEQLDPGWAWTLKNDLMNHMPKWMGKGYGVADFVKHDGKQPVVLEPANGEQVRIAIIGDWGSGKYKLEGLSNNNGPAYAVMDTLKELDTAPDYIIHLGDTYYSGTGEDRSPQKEELHNFTEVLSHYPQLAKKGHCFTLNSNHEMYGGAYGYFDVALKNPLFSAQKGCSYFALEFGEWILAGIDSAYFDPSNLYMEGGLGKEGEDPQYQFLKQLRDTKKKIILLSHHTGLNSEGTDKSKHLWDNVTGVLKPDIWYWGHTHLGMVYNSSAFSGEMKTRCIGHSSMPFAIPPGMANCKTVDWYSKTPLDSTAELMSIYYNSPRAKNGFALLTLGKNGKITEETYEIGNNKPVWSESR